MQVIMKLYTLIGICFLAGLWGCSKSSTTEAIAPSPVDFNVYTRYIYKGPESQSDTTFYYCTTTKAAFDALFYNIYDINNSDTIPASDFSTKKVISIVKYGNDFHVLNVKGLSLYEGILYVAYSDSLVSENMSWTAAIPLIITTGADFQMARFIENGALRKEIYQ
jgi:hypothetical protein